MTIILYQKDNFNRRSMTAIIPCLHNYSHFTYHMINTDYIHVLNKNEKIHIIKKFDKYF